MSRCSDILEKKEIVRFHNFRLMRIFTLLVTAGLLNVGSQKITCFYLNRGVFNTELWSATPC